MTLPGMSKREYNMGVEDEEGIQEEWLTAQSVYGIKMLTFLGLETSEVSPPSRSGWTHFANSEGATMRRGSRAVPTTERPAVW